MPPSRPRFIEHTGTSCDAVDIPGRQVLGPYKDREMLMRSYTEYLWFNTDRPIEFINMTATIEEIVRKSGVREAMCLVNAHAHHGFGLHQTTTKAWLTRDLRK
jgi:Uncharacterized conserved protein